MEKYHEVKSIDLLSLAKIQGLIGAAIGVLVGVVFFFMALFFSFFMPAVNEAKMLGIGMGFASIIFFPLFYGIAGFLGGLITALIYNLVAKWIGGIKVQLK